MNNGAGNSIHSLLKHARQQLQAHSDSAALDAELLLAHCLAKQRTFLHTWPEKIPTAKQRNCFRQLIKKRLSDYPIAYLLGTKAFWTLDLLVTPEVLIPRPETELLVEHALELIKPLKQPKILDLGTGSGAIALALASERGDAAITATDISGNALQVAKHNAHTHQLGNVNFIRSNWFAALNENDFDLIVANPPYIASDDPHLSGTIRHEPQQALVAENQGLQAIRHIIKNSPAYLKHEGWLIIEHGFDQALAVQKLYAEHAFSSIKSQHDVSSHLRITQAQQLSSVA